jgi:adenosylcobinamide-GDP ribazoletransferase
LTGGLHEDGLADTADGIGGGRDRDSKLAIMRDSRIGTYGVMALVLGLIVKAACLGALAQGPATAVIALLAASGAFSRALIVWLMASTPPARSDGLAQSVGQPSDFTSRNTLLVGGVITILLLLLTRGVVPAVATMVIGALVAVLVRSVAMRQVGGHTGDICGALQFLVETAMIAAAASLS